ncbi:fibrinogen-like protein 1 [Drosophila nasuta]|uniref:fibrinogen-like protein 1 n=1 Tax=Drosophila nasuta TaxID=42062 RepID=UPI00295EADFD|nr:fibrinogen-like protein 1 [Drosophila nasuta]
MGRKIIKSVFLLILHEILFVATAAAEKPCQLSNIPSGSNIDGILQLLDCLHIGNEFELSKVHEDHIKELNVNFMEYQEIEKIHEKVMDKAIELDEYRNKILKGSNDLQVCQIEVDKLESEINVQKTTIDRLKTNSKLFGEYDKCKGELIRKRNKLKSLKHNVDILNATLIKKDALIEKRILELQNITKNQKTIQLELDDYQNKLRLKESDIQFCQFNLIFRNDTTQKRQHTRILTSCISFGDHPGVHQIEALYYDVFDVLCDSQIAGPGWIVIQQRVGGNESFNRDWATYRKGFGSFESDFFLGLEKIHRLTSSQDHELYVHLVFLNGTIKYAQYDNFKISNEENSYALSSLGKFKGNVVDEMRNYLNSKFSTFDQDNDTEDVHNCAEHFKSGWWFTHCYYCNLNALYGKDLNWYPPYELKEARMMIRPRKVK